MRKAFVCLAPAVAAAILWACDDSGSSSGGGQFTFDGGQFDGFVPVTPDGAAPDADAAAPLPVTVKVARVGAAGAANITVVWHDAAGAVTGTTKTDANGLAVSPLPAPSMATALLGQPGGAPHALTWMGTKGGDVLLANDDDVTGVPVGSYDVSLNQATIAGSVEWSARAGACAFGGFTQVKSQVMNIPLEARCAATPGAVLAESHDDTLSNINGFAFAKNLFPVADAGTVPVTTGAWVAPSTVTLTISNIPDGGIPPSPIFTEVAGALSFRYPNPSLDAAGQAKFTVAPGFADAYQFAMIEEQSPNGYYARRLTGKRSAPAAAISLDRNTALPFLSTGDVDVSADPRRPKITWTAAGSLATTDGGSINFSWYTGQDFRTAWTIIVPPDLAKNEIQAPALPADATAWLPPLPDAGAIYQVDPPQVIFAESDALASYDQFRAIAGLAIPPPNSTQDLFLDAVLPANGTLRLTSVENLPK